MMEYIVEEEKGEKEKEREKEPIYILIPLQDSFLPSRKLQRIIRFPIDP